jgi:hypothetical protein
VSLLLPREIDTCPLLNARMRLRENDLFMGLSFDTISSTGANGGGCSSTQPLPVETTPADLTCIQRSSTILPVLPIATSSMSTPSISVTLEVRLGGLGAIP